MTTNTRCAICGWYGRDKLCNEHKMRYMWDSSIKSYRLKKRSTGSRYTQANFHGSEVRLTKALESFYGSSNIFTSIHPIWAITSKNVLYEFDILIKSNNTLIEYNGIQHYKFTKFFQKSKKSFKDQKQRDKLKYKLAKENGYNIIVFKYNEPIFKDYVINKIERNIQ